MLEKEKILLKYIELKQCHVYQLGIFFCLILIILLMLSIIELKLFIVLTSSLFISVNKLNTIKFLKENYYSNKMINLILKSIL